MAAVSGPFGDVVGGGPRWDPRLPKPNPAHKRAVRAGAAGAGAALAAAVAWTVTRGAGAPTPAAFQTSLNQLCAGWVSALDIDPALGRAVRYFRTFTDYDASLAIVVRHPVDTRYLEDLRLLPAPRDHRAAWVTIRHAIGREVAAEPALADALGRGPAGAADRLKALITSATDLARRDLAAYFPRTASTCPAVLLTYRR
jgi:hypothetical protein